MSLFNATELHVLKNALAVARDNASGNTLDSMMTVENIEKAQRIVNALDRGDVIADPWWIDDVRSMVEDDDGEPTVKLTDQQCRDVLDTAQANHDANSGINWDTLRDALDMTMEAYEKDEEYRNA